MINTSDTDAYLPQANSYQPLRSVANGQIKGSVIDTQDEALVSQIRRAIGGTFAEKNILDYEAEVDETCDQLIQVIHQSQQFDLFAITGGFQADFLSKIAFGEEAQHLQAGADSSYLSFHSRFRHWMQWQAMPYLELLWCKTPYLIPYFKAKTHPPLWARMADLKLQSRLAEPEQRSSGLKKPDLLEKYLRGGERRGDKLPLEAIPRMVSSTISAGFDTTAFTMTTMLYFLCRTPSTMEKLCRELDEAHLTTRPSFHDTQHLKYLGAVMKETMRLYPFLQLLLEREAPSGGATVCGKHLPAGAIVGCHPSISHRDPALYGQDADMFRPERWLTVCPEKLSVMDKASLGFGNGKRICIGRHLAEMEIKTVVPRLLLAFNVSVMEPSLQRLWPILRRWSYSHDIFTSLAADIVHVRLRLSTRITR